MQVYQAMKQLYENENITPFKFEFDDEEQTLTCEQYDVPIKIKVNKGFKRYMEGYTHLINQIGEDTDNIEQLVRIVFKGVDATWCTEGNVFNIVLKGQDVCEDDTFLGRVIYNKNGEFTSRCCFYKSNISKYHCKLLTTDPKEKFARGDDNNFESAKIKKQYKGHWAAVLSFDGSTLYTADVFTDDENELLLTSEDFSEITNHKDVFVQGEITMKERENKRAEYGL